MRLWLVQERRLLNLVLACLGSSGLDRHPDLGITGLGIKTRRNTCFQRPPVGFITELIFGEEHFVKLQGGIKVLCWFSVLDNYLCKNCTGVVQFRKEKTEEGYGKSLTLIKKLLFLRRRAINCSLCLRQKDKISGTSCVMSRARFVSRRWRGRPTLALG